MLAIYIYSHTVYFVLTKMIELFNKPIFVINISFKCNRLKLHNYILYDIPPKIQLLKNYYTLLYSIISVGKYNKKTSALRIGRDLKITGTSS